MKKIHHYLLTAVLLTTFNGQAFAEEASTEMAENIVSEDCLMPAAPIIPDGNVASEDELVAAQQGLKLFQANLTDYRACIQKLEASIDEEAKDADDQSAAILDNYNASVDSEEKIAEEFNAAVRAFKSRQSED